MVLPLPLLLLLCGLVLAVAARFVSPRAAVKDVQSEEQETIFVCIVGCNYVRLWELAKHFLSQAQVPSLVSVGIVVLVQDGDVHELDHHHPSISVRREFCADPSTALVDARQTCCEHLYRNERYVLFTHGVAPCAGWDTASRSLLDDDEDMVLHCLPNAHGAPSFPTVQANGEGRLRIGAKAFRLLRKMHTPSCLWVNHYAFFHGSLLARCPMFLKGQVAQLEALAKHSVLCRTCAWPLCTPGSRNGVGATGSHAASLASCGEHPHLGIVSMEDQTELIVKFGNVDAARIAVDQSLARGA